MRPLWTQPLHTSASIPLDYASKGYVDGVLAIPDVICLLDFHNVQKLTIIDR